MTKWELKCKRCGNTRIVDLGFNLYEFSQVYLYCPVCKENTFHKVVKPVEE